MEEDHVADEVRQQQVCLLLTLQTSNDRRTHGVPLAHQQCVEDHLPQVDLATLGSMIVGHKRLRILLLIPRVPYLLV